MRTSLLQLNDLGILSAASLPKSLSWLTDGGKFLLLDLQMAGELGLHKSAIAKFEKKYPRAGLHLEANSCADWQTNRQGKPERLVLSPKGEEIAVLVMTVARVQSQLVAQGHPVPN